MDDAIRVAILEISPNIWLEIKIVTPLLKARSCNSSLISTIPAGSSPLAGSSKISISGLCIMALPALIAEHSLEKDFLPFYPGKVPAGVFQ